MNEPMDKIAAEEDRRHARRAQRSTALLIPCPWSGDERDPPDWRYWLWYRLYRTTRQLRHRLDLHDWRGRRCSWCGKVRP